MPFALLRNSWYTENFLSRVASALNSGVLDGAAKNGRVSSAARADYAEAAACVLAGDGHAGRTYELAGDGSFTLADLASSAGAAAKRSVIYRDLTPDEYEAAAIGAGVPERFAHLLAEVDAGTAQGALYDDSGTLAKLIGRPTTRFDETIAAFVETRRPYI